jgi:hypothetical protein
MSKKELYNFPYREKESSLFHRYEKNPILQPEDWPYEVILLLTLELFFQTKFFSLSGGRLSGVFASYHSYK